MPSDSKVNGWVFFVWLLLLCTFPTHAQHAKIKEDRQQVDRERFNDKFCGAEGLHQAKLGSDPAYKTRFMESRKSIQKAAKGQLVEANGVYQIPVVVHVMHKGEPFGTGTNISDADVRRGVANLNNYFRKMEGSLGDGDGVDMQMEFVLAIRDENGNCTNGINRVDMSGVPAYVANGVDFENDNGIPDYDSSGGINSLKEYGAWDPTQYYNVWLVDEIDNTNCFSGGSYISGYAYYATEHGRPWDGSVVLMCSFLDESSTTWAHEMGHAFNLPHTFDGDDSNFDGVVDQCGDDGILDTPKHQRTSSIVPNIYFDCDNTGTNTCDPGFDEIINPETGFRRNSGTHQDYMHNYMDYTGCPTEFTGGQRAVVHNAANTYRSSYLSSPALSPVSLASVDFKASGSVACIGTSIQFTDLSTCTPNSYTNGEYNDVSFLWTFDNGIDEPIISSFQNPKINFTVAGTYDVTLEVTNMYGTSSETKQDYITIAPSIREACPVASFNDGADYGNGVLSVRLNDLENSTSTFIPSGGLQDFSCSQGTRLFTGVPYPLEVAYESRSDGDQFLEVWIDWDDSGSFELSNAQGANERVLADTIGPDVIAKPSATVVPPATAVQNKALRMRVISDHQQEPVVCDDGSVEGFVQRADDYAVYVMPCVGVQATINNLSGETELSCSVPLIELSAAGGVSYGWDNGLGNGSTVSVTAAGTYTVIVTGANGCSDSASITITQSQDYPQPPVSAGDVIACLEGHEDILKAEAATTDPNQEVIWYDAPTGGNLVVDPSWAVLGSMTYYAESRDVITDCRSVARTPVTLTLLEAPVAAIDNLTMTTELSCSVPLIELRATGSLQYNWDMGLGDSSEVSITEPGTYTVTVTGEGICVDTASITITQADDLPEAPITGGDVAICSDDGSQTITATASTAEGQEVIWYDSPTEGNLVTDPSLAMVGNVTYYAESRDLITDCRSTARTPVTLTLLDAPVAAIDNMTGGTELSCSVRLIELRATGGDSYHWDNGLGDGAEVSITGAGTYTVTVTNENGCVDTASIEISWAGTGTVTDCFSDQDEDGILDTEDNCPETYNPNQSDMNGNGIGDACEEMAIQVSEAITPNGDGVNDTWVIQHIETYPGHWIRVYNRWGQEVLSTGNYKNDWQGGSGSDALGVPQGTSYLYQIDLENDGVIDQQGWLVIKR